ncbi:MAG: hypothetical protein R3D29_04630 [Nitratireductor sp.]
MEETASTNSDCLVAAYRRSRQALDQASRQTAGKGSRGRDWVSVDGNLYASLLLIDPGPREKLAGLTLLQRLRCVKRLLNLQETPNALRDISLKWPNDVLVSGKKVSGILLSAMKLTARRW